MQCQRFLLNFIEIRKLFFFCLIRLPACSEKNYETAFIIWIIRSFPCLITFLFFSSHCATESATNGSNEKFATKCRQTNNLNYVFLWGINDASQYSRFLCTNFVTFFIVFRKHTKWAFHFSVSREQSAKNWTRKKNIHTKKPYVLILIFCIRSPYGKNFYIKDNVIKVENADFVKVILD